MDTTVLGLFTNRQDVENAIDTLQEEGFATQDMSIAMKDTREAKEINESTGVNIGKGVASGVATGAVVGGIAGLLAGTVVPALGGLIIAGPIGAALGLTGAAATTVSGAVEGAVAGGLVGALMGVGLPKENAEHYESRVKEGAILLVVPAAIDEEDVVIDIFNENHASDVRAVSQEQSLNETQYKDQTPGYQFATTGVKGGQRSKGRKHGRFRKK